MSFFFLAYRLQVLEHNLSGGKHSRGLITMLSYEMLENPDKITDEKLKLSRVLGWCVEMVTIVSYVINFFSPLAYSTETVHCYGCGIKCIVFPEVLTTFRVPSFIQIRSADNYDKATELLSHLI